MEVYMGKDQKPDDGKEVITQLEIESQEVEPGTEPEPKIESTPDSGAKTEKEPAPGKEPVPDKELVRDFTAGLVKTLDVVQTGICLTISKRERTEENKSYYNFGKDDSQALRDVWYPIVLKWYLKIPMELVAIGVTATVLTANFAKAKADAIENKK